MKLEHIALNITDSKEVENFYHNILGMIDGIHIHNRYCPKPLLNV